MPKSLYFNSRGDLYRTIHPAYEKFLNLFATNARRRQMIVNALPFFRIFYSCSVQIVYIGGSFVSTKKLPEDIDLCFDITPIDEIKLRTEFPQFLDPNAIGSIRRDLRCHIFHFDALDREHFDLLSGDREGNPKGLVRLELKEISDYYDQK
jgi:hypothetical protein